MIIQSSSLTTILAGSGYVAASQPNMSDFHERLTYPSPYPNAEQTKDWIADWIADPRPCYRAVTTVVQGVLMPDLVSICVEYAQGTENENVLAPRKWEVMECRNVSIAPRLPLSFEGVWNSICPGYEGEKVREICYLQFRPKEVNGELLTPNVMDEIAQNVPAPLNRAKIAFLPVPLVKGQIGYDGLEESAWELVPRRVIEASRGKSDGVQETQIPVGWARPQALSVIIANLTRYIFSGEQRVRMYGDIPPTGVRCVERVGGCRVIVGGMTPAKGLNPARLNVFAAAGDGVFAVVGLLSLK